MEKTTTLPTANLSDTRMDEFWDNLDPGLTQPKPAHRDLDVGLSDLARATGAGGLELVGGIGELARQAANYGRAQGGKEQGDYLENARANMAAKLAPVLDVVGGLGDLAQSGADSLKDGMSADAKEAMSRSLVAETPQGRLELGDGAGDIDVWAMKMAQGVGSLLPTLLSGGVTGVAARATVGRMVTSSMLKKGVSQEVAEAVAAKTVARLATGAATATGVTGSVGAAGVNARDSVLGMSFDALSNSTTFRDAFLRIDGDQQLAHLSDSDKLAMAREETANLASQATMGDAKTWGAAAVGTLMGDTMLFKMLAGKGAGAGVLKGMAKGAAGEGVSEALEEGTQQYSVNEALNEVAGANIDPMKGVVSSAIEGGLIGAGVGGATGGVSGIRGERAQPQSGERDQQPTQEQGVAEQAEPVAAPADEIITETQQHESPLGPSASQFDELRDVPAYLRQDGSAERFKGLAEDSEVQRALAGEFGQSVQELVAAQMQGGEQGKSLYERVQAGELGADPFAGDKSALQVAAESQRLQLPIKDVIFAGDASTKPAMTDVAAPGDHDDRQVGAGPQFRGAERTRWQNGQEGDLLPPERDQRRHATGALPGATFEGEGRELGSELPFRDVIYGADQRQQETKPSPTREERVAQQADDRLMIGQSDTIFAGGAPGSDQRNSAYTPPRLSRDQVDRSLGEQSTRDPRSQVARAIEQAGGEHDSIFGPLKSLRITRKGKPFASEKEAALASRKGQETPVPLNGGGFGVAAIEEVEQAKGAIEDNSEEQSHEQIAGVDPVGSKGEGDQQPTGTPVSAVAGAEPDTADALPSPAREHSPAPDAARDANLPDDDALTPAPAGVAVSEEVKSEKAASDPTERIETARAEVAQEPSEAQKDAGNYKKGHLTLHGLDIALENPKGSTRTGTDPAGKAWQSTMVHDYGYIKRTLGADGDHVDVFIGDEPDNGTVYVVDQVDPKTGKFDEHKVMMGFASERAAREGYLANYEKGWKGLSAIKAMPMAEFKRWVKEGDTTKPIAASLNTDGKITDFGEKIGGARKDVWASYRDSIQGDTVDEIKELPLSKVWPTPDYQKLIDSGIQPWFVAYARAARDSIPAKPQIGWKQQRWAEAVKTMRDTALGLLAGDSSSEQLRQQIAKSGLHLAEDISNRAALYEAVGHQRSLADLKLRGGEYSLYNGVKYDPPKQMWTLERGAKSSTLGNWPRIIATGDTKQEAIAAFKARYEELTAEASKPKAVTFDIYSRNDGKGWFVGKKLGRNYLDLTPAFKDVKEARAYRTAHQDELITKLEQHKAIPRERRDFNQPRVGEDMRAGQDITPEQFASTFGFRGVEFGNWVEQGRRQRDLNDAFDALMDMAAILGIPPKAISLNGELGLAFGARGSGGVSPAAAHYEPGKIVINLTKMNGAGSLGHEWWHALDNYFSRLRGKPGDYMTTALDVSLAARGSNFVHRGEVRKEMVEAFGAVMRAIKQTSLKARSHKLDSRRSKAYWATDVELSARAFESYLIAKLQDQSASNDYLANIVSEEQWEAEAALGLEMDGSYPYATAGEVPAIRAGFDQFFDTLESKQEGNRTILFSKQAQAKGEPPAKHLTRKEAEMVTRGWLKQYRGVDGIDIQIHATQAEMERALGLPPVDGLIRRAAFDRITDALHVAADTISNPRHLREILRHEVLAHYGLAKVLGGGHYTRLLSRVMSSRNDAAMKGVWEWVQTNYADEPIMVQAEEVIAHLAELEPSAWRRGWDRVVSWVTRALRTVGFVSDGVTAAEIRSMIEAMGKQLEKGRGSASSELGSLRFSAERTPWKPGFPEVILHSRLGDATAHPDYEAAKGGDDAAARRLVSDVLTKGAVRRLKELIGDREAIALGVHAEEAVSRNAIPSAMADVLGSLLGIEVELDIVQAAKVGRTAQDGFGRLANQPSFDGPVRTDKPYLIMDDTLTQGGTLANLKGHIEHRGGEVLAATALTGKQYSAKIAIDSSTLEQLRDQYDGTGLEAWWQNRFGYGFDSLTESEARYLLRAKDADKIRDRVAAAGSASPARSEHESARDDGSLPPDHLIFPHSPLAGARVDDPESLGQDRPTFSQEFERESLLFKPIQAEAENFRQQLTKAMASLRSGDIPIEIGHTPAVLQVVGAPELTMRISRDTVRKAVNGVKHDVDLATIEDLPELLSNPLVVFDSKSHPGDALVVLLDAKDRSGRPVVTALQLKVSGGKFLDINRIASVHGRPEEQLQGWINAGLVRYIKKNHPGSLRTGLQLPIGSSMDGSSTNLLSESDVVKQGIRFSQSLDGQAHSLANTLNAHIRYTPGSAIGVVKNFLKQKRPVMLGTLTDLQIDQVYRDITGGAVSRYQRLRTQMEAERNDILLDAETRIDPLWDALDKQVKAALSNLMHDATMARLHPDKSLDENSYYLEAKQKRDRAKKPETRFAYEAELRIIERNHAELARQYQALPANAKALYGIMQDTYTKQWESLRGAIEQRLEDLLGANQGRAMAAEMRQKMEHALQHGPYFPLTRYGDYVVKARKGDEYVREHFERRSDAEQAVKQYQRDGYNAVMTVKEEGGGDSANVNQLGMEMLSFLDSADGVSKSALKDEIWQAMLRMMPDASYAKHAIHRRRVKGASRDAHRAYLNSVYHYARHVSKIRYGHKMQGELDKLSEQIRAGVAGEPSSLKSEDLEIAQQVLNEMNKRHDLNMNPTGKAWAGSAGNIGFLYYIGPSVASAVVNMTQNFTVMLPQLGAKYGFAKSAVAMTQALGDYVKHGKFKAGTTEAWHSLTRSTTLPEDERAILDRLYRAGALDLTQAHSIAAKADTDQQDAKPMGRRWRRAMRWAGATFHNAEVLNREVAALAAYRLLKQAEPTLNAQQYADRVAEMVYDGHGNYAASNRPRYMRSDITKVLTQFKIYSQMMTYVLYSNAIKAAKGDKVAQKTLAGVLATHWVMAGVMGLPTPITAVVYAIAAGLDDDDDRSGEASFRLALTEALGPRAGELLAKGPMDALTNLSIAGRTGLGDLWWRSPKEGSEGDDLAWHAVQQLLGPVAGIGINLARGAGQMTDGHIQRGLETVLPKSIRDVAKAYRQATEGEQTIKGDLIMDDVSTWNVAMQGLGFGSAQMAKNYDAREYIKGKEKRIADKRSQLLTDYYMARKSGDLDEVQEVLERIKMFNATHHPGERITSKSLALSFKSKLRSNERTQGGVYLNRNREYLREEGSFAD